MHPTSFSCARCGMAAPVDDERCRACGARRFVGESPAGSARTGPAAAEAWAASRAAAPTAEAVRGGGSAASSRPSAHPVGPWAVGAWRVLHLVALLGVAIAAVAAVRLVLAAAADDQAVLLAERGWEVLDGLSGALAVALAGGAALAATLGIVWAAAAGRNLRRLSLDPGAWTRSSERFLGRSVVLLVAAAAWVWAPNGPDQFDRCVDLGLTLAAAAAVASAAMAAQRLLVVVTTAELERAEWLLRLEAAATPRPKGRGTPLAS